MLLIQAIKNSSLPASRCTNSSGLCPQSLKGQKRRGFVQEDSDELLEDHLGRDTVEKEKEEEEVMYQHIDLSKVSKQGRT